MASYHPMQMWQESSCCAVVNCAENMSCIMPSQKAEMMSHSPWEPACACTTTNNQMMFVCTRHHGCVTAYQWNLMVSRLGTSDKYGVPPDLKDSGIPQVVVMGKDSCRFQSQVYLWSPSFVAPPFAHRSWQLQMQMFMYYPKALEHQLFLRALLQHG